MNQVNQIIPGVYVVKSSKRKTKEEIERAEERMKLLLDEMKSKLSKGVEKCS
ncbi:hypothetical protein [Alkalihalobacterium alkalinitrilicum]|uniref:hypothetical protein n=1 Tax=Alkalihalobacterium alkalinitrilicum TaxID=427920 RepID=UPI001303137B|nr:hypothetical protein [Alkalihalobacterium alkalinitrilicum]